MHGKDIVFVFLAVLAVGSAAIVVFSKRIVYAAFALMLSLFCVAGFYVLLSADFLAAVQVIIYVGGILVLLLFGVLLTVKVSDVTVTTQTTQRVWGAVIGIGLMFILLMILFVSIWPNLADMDVEIGYKAQTAEIGEELMTNYLFPFELASILLLAALVGSMFIIRSEDK
ncbi:NADH-quinone oxidoreductase subunit J [candidate division KSB1 bacterium]